MSEKLYKIDQALLDMNSKELESVEEAKLKQLKQKFGDAYTEARKNRLETQKKFLVAYYNSRDLTVILKELVNSGKVTPDKAIAQFREYVASDKLLVEKVEEKKEVSQSKKEE